MLEKRLTFLDLESLSGLKCGTIQNILSGFSSSTRSRQAITNALGAEIFHGIHPKEARQAFLKGTTIEFIDSPELAAQFAKECKTKMRVRGCAVTFLEGACLTLSFARMRRSSGQDLVSTQ